MPEAWHRHSWKRWRFLFASQGRLWQTKELFLGIQASSLPHAPGESPCCCGDATTTAHRWAGWQEELQHYLCCAKQVTLESWFAATFFYLQKGLGDILNRGGQSDKHWSSGSWRILIVQYGSATGVTQLRQRGNITTQCCLFMQLLWLCLSLHFGISVSGTSAVLAAPAAASRHFVSPASIFSGASQRSLRLDGLDIMSVL